MIPETTDHRLSFHDLLDDSDFLLRLLASMDWDAQLNAIRDVLARNRSAAQQVSANIAQLRECAKIHPGPHRDHMVDEYVDAMLASSYSDAAVSLSAIGMIVPMAESVFFQTFQSLGSMYLAKKLEPPDHPRWHRAGPDPDRWNCQWYFGRYDRRNDIISGLPQLSEAAGLSTYLEPDTMDWIAAMLSYRNRMFHGGFEWSLSQRDQFETLIAAREWDKYFQSARTDGKPWIFYLRDEVIDEMPRRIETILAGFGRFAKDLPLELLAT